MVGSTGQGLLGTFVCRLCAKLLYEIIHHLVMVPNSAGGQDTFDLIRRGVAAVGIDPFVNTGKEGGVQDGVEVPALVVNLVDILDIIGIEGAGHHIAILFNGESPPCRPAEIQPSLKVPQFQKSARKQPSS